MTLSSSIVTKIGWPKLLFGSLTVVLSLYIIVNPPLSGNHSHDTMMRILAIIISIFGTTDMFLAWYMSNETFNDPSLMKIKGGFILSLTFVRFFSIVFWMLVAGTHTSITCWIVIITLLGDPLLSFMQFIQQKVDLVRAKQHSKDSANTESYDIETEAN